MHLPTRVFVLAMLVVLQGICLVPGVAAAEPAPLASSLTGDAKAAYDSGRLLYDDKDFAGAATKFGAAYRASHDARLLWNMATCEKELRHYGRAAKLIEAFISGASTLVSPEYRAQARVTLDALRAFYSPVTFMVVPAGTHVFIDDEDVGTAPLATPVSVDLGRHAVRAEHEGFTPYQAPIDVSGQAAMSLRILLRELPAVAKITQLAVSASDPGDTVAVDGAVVGSGRWQGDVTPGSHRVKVSAAGKKSYAVDIEVAAGEHRSVDVTLEKDHGGLIWPWIAGGAAVVAGGVVGGYFLFRPSSTTSAPPAGAIPTITLQSVGRGHGGAR